jgi:transglutaminase-like putative cysteine protease
VAIGLVGSEREGGFAYHMWNEVWLDGRWVPLDATLRRGGIGAAHLKISHTNLHDVSPYAPFLPVYQLLGRLQIEIVEME